MNPKVLIVARGVWDDTKGISSTLTSLFDNYGPDRLAHIYIETKAPNTKCCNNFFQISEFSLVRKLVRWNTITGRKVFNNAGVQDTGIANKEDQVFAFSRKHRSCLLSFMRDVLWSFGGWKTKELDSFIKEYDPDVVWLDGSTNVFLNKLYKYVVQKAQKPVVFFMMDDNYTFESVENNRYLARLRMRKSVDAIMSLCNKLFVISPKMKEEYDRIFKTDSTIITKGIDYSNLDYQQKPVSSPVKLLYMGQIIYGRDYTIQQIMDGINRVNSDGMKITFDIYTNNIIPASLQKLADESAAIEIHQAVPYTEVQNVIAEHDVLLFVESLDKRYCKGARLSFSTKITDYLTSGKCIFAVGPDDCAPMEYFVKEGCADVSVGKDSIDEKLQVLLNPTIVQEYSRKAFDAGKRNHEKQMMQNRLYTEIEKASQQSYLGNE